MQHLIEHFGLIPHPEGGYYREVYRSAQHVSSTVVGQKRAAVTHIYFLLDRGQVSRFHRVAHDEIWNFYEGAPLRLITFDGRSLDETTIGTGADQYIAVVPGGCYQAAESTGDYSLVGCSVAPGFDFADFGFMADDPEIVRQLTESFPELGRFV